MERQKTKDTRLTDRGWKSRRWPFAFCVLPWALGLVPYVFISACIPMAIVGGRNELALVNGEPITLEYIRMTFKSKHGDILILLQDEGSLNKYLDRAINLKLLSQEAYRLGLDGEEGTKRRAEEFKLNLAKEKLLKDELAEVKEPQKRREKREGFISHLRESAEIEARRDFIPLLLPEKGGEETKEEVPYPGEIIAQVGKEGITIGMLRRKLNPNTLARLERDKALEVVEGALNGLIDDLLLKREAVKRGYVDKEVVLKETKIFEEGLLREGLYREAILPHVKITYEEVELYYRDHPEEFTLPERANISHILLKTREEAQQILSELKGGGDFEQMALTRSTDRGTSQRLGKIGWVARGKLDADFERAAFALKVGEVSDIVETRFGFHIIRLEGRKEEAPMDFSRLKGLVHKKVLDKKRKERVEYWIGKLREKSDIEINEKKVEEVQKALIEGKVPKS